MVAATLVETVGSAPLDPGAEMLVDDAVRDLGFAPRPFVVGIREEAHAAGDDRAVTERLGRYGRTLRHVPPAQPVEGQQHDLGRVFHDERANDVEHGLSVPEAPMPP